MKPALDVERDVGGFGIQPARSHHPDHTETRWTIQRRDVADYMHVAVYSDVSLSRRYADSSTLPLTF